MFDGVALDVYFCFSCFGCLRFDCHGLVYTFMKLCSSLL